MSRPQKEGMDYFPHDTDASNDEKVEALRSLYGNDGYAFYFILLERIYRTPQAELDISDAETGEETRRILAKKVAVTLEQFEKMLQTALKWGCFDKEAYTAKGVLTSPGIKKRAGIVLAKRDKMRARYQSEQQDISDAETGQKSGRNSAETGEETPQRKVKESKGKQIVIFLSPEESAFLSELEKIKGYPLDREKDIEMLNTLKERYPQVDPVEAIKDWAILKIEHPLEDGQNPRSQINTSFKKCVEWGKNLKKPDADKPKRNIDM